MIELIDINLKNIEKEFNLNNTIFYTFWLNFITHGLCVLKEEYPGLKVISRTHNIDLYEDQHPQSYIPARDYTMRTIDLIFPDSISGLFYIEQKYGAYKEKYVLGLLGVKDPGFSTKPSNDGILRIVSCSHCNLQKRVDLILKAVIASARNNNIQNYEWTHIGGGTLIDDIKREAKSVRVSNLRIIFIDYLTNDKLIEFYKNNNIDLFINCSCNEAMGII